MLAWQTIDTQDHARSRDLNLKEGILIVWTLFVVRTRNLSSAWFGCFA